MKYLFSALLLFASSIVFAQDRKEEFIKLDTTRGLITTVNGEMMTISLGYKVDSVFKVSADAYHDPNTSYRNGITSAGGSWYTKETIESRLKSVVTEKGKVIDIKKWYQFVPESGFQCISCP